MWKIVIAFGILCSALLVLFQLAEFRMMKTDANIQVIVAVLAIVFFALGVIFRKRFEFTSKKEALSTNWEALGVSKREFEVLQELVSGATNKEIGEKLFLSESTIKSHLSSVYQKLEVKNRAQAINKVKEAGLV